MAAYPILLVICSALSASLFGYGGFTTEKWMSSFLGAITFKGYYSSIHLLAIFLLFAYNFLVGIAWTSKKLIKHRKLISIKKAATSPLTIFSIFVFIAYGSINIMKSVERSKTESLIENLFSESTTTESNRYETRLSHPLDSSIFNRKIKQLEVHDDYSLIRLDDDTDLLAVINENKNRIVITKN